MAALVKILTAGLTREVEPAGFFAELEWEGIMRPNKNRKGLTLAEAMMAVVLVGMAASGVLLPFAGGQAARLEGRNRTLAAKLASDLTEQIVNTPFDQIISTYNGYSESQGSVKNTQGEILSDDKYSKFSRTAQCEYVYMAQQSGVAAANLICVTVRVSHKGNEIICIKRLVGR